MRIVTWNIERHSPHSWQAQSLISEIESLGPDMVCLTEAFESSMSSLPGHAISVTGAKWSPQAPDERKVLVWSASSWERVERPEALNCKGAAVAGITRLDGRPVRVAGLCLPYHAASPLGQVPRARQWTQQEAFLDELIEVAAVWRAEDIPVIVLGDFNQFVPRIWGSKRASEKLMCALKGFDVVTAGLHPGYEKHAIDHVALTRELACKAVAGLSRFDDRGKARSDHFGIVVDAEYRA
ncbi:MAG: endonuclease/exonuclease/phosphatase family protein [Hyphomonas sp.]